MRAFTHAGTHPCFFPVRVCAPPQFVDPPAEARIGERVIVAGSTGEPDVEVNPAKKVNPWVACVPHLATDAGRVAAFKGQPLIAAECGGRCTAPTVAGGPIS